MQTSRHSPLATRHLIARAMRNEHLEVVRMLYRDAAGKQTLRVVSPVRWLKHRSAFTALCLGREECRTFRMDRIVSAELVSAADVLMPEQIRVTSSEQRVASEQPNKREGEAPAEL